MKYVIYIDYRVTSKNKYEYRTMEAKNFKEAIEEAEKIYDSKTMYLIRIMEREGKAYRVEGDPKSCKSQNFRAVECKRSCEGGWHSNTNENSEREHVVRYTRMKERNCQAFEWFDLID